LAQSNDTLLGFGLGFGFGDPFAFADPYGGLQDPFAAYSFMGRRRMQQATDPFAVPADPFAAPPATGGGGLLVDPFAAPAAARGGDPFSDLFAASAEADLFAPGTTTAEPLDPAAATAAPGQAALGDPLLDPFAAQAAGGIGTGDPFAGAAANPFAVPAGAAGSDPFGPDPFAAGDPFAPGGFRSPGQTRATDDDWDLEGGWITGMAGGESPAFCVLITLFFPPSFCME
jgi:hypothetical protein